MPLWLKTINALLLGSLVLFFSLIEQDTSWRWAFNLASSLAVLLVIAWYRGRRRRGLEVKILPSSAKGRLVNALALIQYLILMYGARLLFVGGILWAPYVAAIAATVVLTVIDHLSPDGRVI